MATLDRKLARDLRHMWQQVLAIALVIACAIAMLVMAFGMMRSLEETRTAYYERNQFANIFALATRAPVSLAGRLAQIPGVRALEHRVVGRAIVELAGFPEPISAHLVSLPEATGPRLNRLVLRAGRMPLPGRSDEALVSETFAEAHKLPPDARISAIINGRRQDVTIVGIALSPEFIYAIDPGSLFPDQQRYGVFWLPREALAAAYNMEGAFNDLTLTTSRGADDNVIIAELDRALRPYGGTGAFARKDQLSDWYLSGELKQLRLMVRFMPAIFLAVAMFLLHIAMTRLIETERQEIGVLKAFGYSDFAIARHYAKFALAVALTGALIGSLLGTWLGHLLTQLYIQFFRFPFLTFVLSAEVYAVGTFLAVATSLAGAAVPAWRAARLAPAVAMQPAAPPQYRPTRFERALLAPFASGIARMILRHIVRWPLRSGLTVLSVGLAGGLYISTAFVIDAMGHLIDVELNRAQRQTLTVTFNQGASPAALHDLAALPGVLRAEGGRAAAVRIRHGHLARRESITGVRPGHVLTQLFDPELEPISPPPRGLALSTKLAELIRAGPGDLVRVEVLEGRRTSFDIRVTGVVERFLGTGAFMDADLLDTYLGEGPRLSSAALLVDGAALDRVYRKLKTMPQVAGVASRTVARDLVRQSIEESILIATIFYMAFAATIALGVIYNAARIALSERGRELASLRVLGYTGGETALILIGEIALLALLALPIACASGWGLAGLLSAAYETDLYRVPFVISGPTYGTAVLIVVVSAIVSTLIVARRVGRLDLISVLKTRE